MQNFNDHHKIIKIIFLKHPLTDLLRNEFYIETLMTQVTATKRLSQITMNKHCFRLTVIERSCGHKITVTKRVDRICIDTDSNIG